MIIIRRQYVSLAITGISFFGVLTYGSFTKSDWLLGLSMVFCGAMLRDMVEVLLIYKGLPKPYQEPWEIIQTRTNEDSDLTHLAYIAGKPRTTRVRARSEDEALGILLSLPSMPFAMMRDKASLTELGRAARVLAPFLGLNIRKWRTPLRFRRGDVVPEIACIRLVEKESA